MSKYNQVYNYEKGMLLFVNNYNNGIEIVTYDELQEALGLKHAIDDKKNYTATNSAICILRRKLIKEHGLNFASANFGNKKEKRRYYKISKVENTEKKNEQYFNSFEKDLNELKVKNDLQVSKTLKVLADDNQKLYNELELLKEENQRLMHENAIWIDKEKVYKATIHSLSTLINI